MKEWALRYAKLGLSVIPISPETKTPLIKFKDKPPLTEREIERIWTEHPNANIALKTDKFFVIDIDVGHGDANGYDSLANWRHADLITPTLQAKTASGGRHLFYLKREDDRMNQNIDFLPSVDIKAHENNYVLVAPSATKKGIYEWDLENSPEKGTMTTASEKLVRAIRAEKPTTYSGDYSSYTPQSGSKTAQLFETIVNGLGDTGGRNNALARFIGGLFIRGVNVTEAYGLARLANDNTPQPLPEKELDATFESVFRNEVRRRGGDWSG